MLVPTFQPGVTQGSLNANKCFDYSLPSPLFTICQSLEWKTIGKAFKAGHDVTANKTPSTPDYLVESVMCVIILYVPSQFGLLGFWLTCFYGTDLYTPSL